MKEKFVDFLIFWFRKIPEIFFINLWKIYFEDEINDFENAMHLIGATVKWREWGLYKAEYYILENRISNSCFLQARIDVENYFHDHGKIKEASDKGWFYFEEDI